MRMLDQLKEFHDLLVKKYEEAGVVENIVKAQKFPQELKPYSYGARLRRKLIREEVKELLEAMVEKDREEIAKELADVLYVVLPVALMYEIDIEEVFNRVQQNNLLKLETGTIRNDGKLVKSPNHPKVYLKDLFENEA